MEGKTRSIRYIEISKFKYIETFDTISNTGCQQFSMPATSICTKNTGMSGDKRAKHVRYDISEVQYLHKKHGDARGRTRSIRCTESSKYRNIDSSIFQYIETFEYIKTFDTISDAAAVINRSFLCLPPAHTAVQDASCEISPYFTVCCCSHPPHDLDPESFDWFTPGTVHRFPFDDVDPSGKDKNPDLYHV